MRPRAAVAALAVLALVGLAGCGEKPQSTAYEKGKYQGKPDTQPWDNAPLAYGDAKWTRGNEKSWEDEINTRNRSQNEYVRIGQ